MHTQARQRLTERPQQLIENRVSFAGPNAELSVYDTYQAAQDVQLKAGELLYCGMLTGKKVLHQTASRAGGSDFQQTFLPHESFVLAPNQQVAIDFPEARLDTPTRCLTIEIACDKVQHIAERLAAHNPVLAPLQQWQHCPQPFLHTPHSQATQSLLQRLFGLFTDNDPDRDLAINYGIDELVSRLLRHRGRDFLLNSARQDPEANALQACVALIERRLDQALDIDQLCQQACMSRSRFYREFKQLLGCTPAEFQQQLRLNQAMLRLRRGDAVTQVCFDLGYANLSHFNHRFKRQFGYSPSHYSPKSPHHVCA
ncbi:helix-turn-helix transcriptional regulator [Atopomonas sediminilitoris]|uniref:helix-turn-helix transcriptional regulator n=1 Tax=Atopomonas sediminilitoris TaxID=2919919 RepID=UPI001F4E4F3E|nr:helix-turn-helix domain-containing protein [Atopomonas sediminilitoris]MCJ8169836.1 AraC family transcriptional regulator [Atopomonas sediminilitoris]